MKISPLVVSRGLCYILFIATRYYFGVHRPVRYFVHPANRKCYMAQTYQQFLENHRAALVLALREVVVQTTPYLPPSEVVGYTERLVQLYISFCLGQPDPAFAAIQAESKGRGVTPSLARPKSAAFIKILCTFCALDTTLTEAERSHITRMLKASLAYMQTMTVVLQTNGLDNRAVS